MNKRFLSDITDFIFMKDAPQKSDVIFIPGSAFSVVPQKAAALYREGYAPYIVPSGFGPGRLGRFEREAIDDPRYDGDFACEADFMKYVMTENGVPADAVLPERRSQNTLENAVFSRELLEEKGIAVRKAIICCQALHARRAFETYACQFPDTEFTVVPADTSELTAGNWYETDAGWRHVIGELRKCGEYFADFRDRVV